MMTVKRTFVVRDDLRRTAVYLTYNSDNDTYTDEINGITYILRTGDFVFNICI